MTDVIDQQITDRLQHHAATASVGTGSFNDVRRRVRARRQRHVAAAVVPAVVGMAWLGTRTAVSPSGPASAPAPSDSVPSSSDTVPDIAVTTSTEIVPTTVVGVSATIPAQISGHVMCVDATSQTDGLDAGCGNYLPNMQFATAPTALNGVAKGSFVVPASPAFQAEAQIVGGFLGLPVLPDMISYLDNDLTGIDTSTAHVFLVIGSPTTTCTVPGC